MGIRPEIFQDVALKRLDLQMQLIESLSDMQIRLGETLVQHIQNQKAISAEAAKKLQDDLSALHGKIVALQPPREND
jgi:hypothetical protein